MLSLPSYLRRLSSPIKVQPLSKTLPDLIEWYNSPSGQVMLSAESQWLNERLNCVFGYHLLSMSTVPRCDLSLRCRINHQFHLAPTEQFADNSASLSTVASYEALPFADESIDVTLLQHVLEFSESPQQLLKEAARVTIANGYIIVLAFNPASLMGWATRIGAHFRDKPRWCRSSLGVHRMRDWLNFVDCSSASASYFCHNLPINQRANVNRIPASQKFINTERLPFGAVYGLIARKDRHGLTPIKPVWQKKRFGSVVPIPKTGMALGRDHRSGFGRSASVIDFSNVRSRQHPEP